LFVAFLFGGVVGGGGGGGFGVGGGGGGGVGVLGGGGGGGGSGRGQGSEARRGVAGKFGHSALRAPFRLSAERKRLRRGIFVAG